MQALANVHEIAHEENLQEENLEKQLQNALGTTTTSRALIPDGTIPHAHLGRTVLGFPSNKMYWAPIKGAMVMLWLC